MEIRYSQTAARQIESLEKNMQKRILQKMRFWCSQPNPMIFARKLTGYDVHRFRVGDWRIICDIVPGEIAVLFIEKRDRIYQRFD